MVPCDDMLFGFYQARLARTLHTEKYFLNLVKSNQIWIVTIFFRSLEKSSVMSWIKILTWCNIHRSPLPEIAHISLFVIFYVLERFFL